MPEIVGELSEFDEVAAVVCDVAGDLRDDARTVGTTELEDES